MFPCAHCNGPTTVTCTELHPDGQHRWRRCTSCGRNTRTIETYLEGRRMPGPLPNAKRKHTTRCPGESNPQAVLTESDVRRLRDQAAAGVPRLTLAAQYGVSPSTVTSIVNRQTWSHVA
jgi:hypothetical protein